MKKEILLTFDYELFFNKSGSIEKCILEPTNKLLEIFSMYGIRATFYVDILYYLRLKNDSRTFDDSLRVKDQLQNLVRAGHRIELHLHPHWLDAIYNGKDWEFPTYENYRLHNLPEGQIIDLFKQGKNELELIAKEIQADYTIISFRAGGFCIQPFEKLRKAFLDNNIRIDSSVVESFYGSGEAHEFDFRGAPINDFYRFSNDVLVHDESGDFIELPIHTFKMNFIGRISNKILTLSNKYQFGGDGIFIGLKNDTYLKGILNRFKSIPKFYSLEFLHKSIIIREINKSKYNLIVVLSHPKTISPASFEIITRLVENGNTFLNIAEWYKKMQK